MTEQPTVKKPAEESTQTPESAQDDILAKLKDLEIDSPEKLENVARASSESGRLANMVGSLKEQNEQLAKQLDELTRNRPPSNDYDYSEGVDISKLVSESVRKEIESYAKGQQQAQQKAEEAYYKDISKVQNDKRYKALKEPFDQHMSKPQVQLAIRRGETTASEEYHKIKDAYFDLMEETYTSKVKKVTEQPTPPHMESNETQTVPMPNVDPTSKDELRKKVDPEKGWVGTNENITELFSGLFPDGDPFMETS